MTIPSLQPLGDAIALENRKLAAKSLPQTLAANTALLAPRSSINSSSGLTVMTLDELVQKSRRTRYVDFPSMSYGSFIEGERYDPNFSPLTSNGKAIWLPNDTQAPTVHVIGMGLSGLLCTWQLAKAGFKVTCFEAGGPPIDNWTGAGRIAPIKVFNDPNLTAQYGAMRFPDTSHLFWHYLKVYYQKSRLTPPSYTAFPNPGKVPTLFAGETTLYASWPGVGFNLDTAQDSGFLYQDLQARHLNALKSVKDTQTGLTIAQVTTLCTSGLMTATDEANVRTFWTNIRKRYYNVNYKQFLIDYRDATGRAFTASEIEVIGYLGLGTGGFKPLFETCVLELLRLIPWNYDNEYAVPELGALPKFLYEQIKAMPNVDTVYNGLYNAAVEGVFFSRTWKKYVLHCRYTAGAGPNKVNKTFATVPADYVVLAMTNKAAAELLGSTKTSMSTISPWCPDPIRVINDQTKGGLPGYYPIVGDIYTQAGMSAVKIFQVIGGPAGYKNAGMGDFSSLVTTATQNPNNWEKYVRVVYGKRGNTPLGVTYFLPYGNTTFTSSQVLLRLHYAWGAEAREIRSNVLNNSSLANSSSVQIKPALDSSGKCTLQDLFYSGIGVRLNSGLLNQLTKISDRTGRVKLPLTFTDYSAPYRVSTFNTAPRGEGQFAIVDWDSVPYVKMGFKLDAPSKGMRSIYSYKALALTPVVSVDNNNGIAFLSDRNNINVYNTYLHPAVKRCHFCGDSFSHFGGWIEGAFQSALATASSMTYDAAKTRGKDPNTTLSAWSKHLILQAPDPYEMGVY